MGEGLSIAAPVAMAQQQQFQEMMQQQFVQQLMQQEMENDIKTYANITDTCFKTCANNFRLNRLDHQEEACVDHCTEKFIAALKRMKFRFQSGKEDLEASGQKITESIVGPQT